MTIWVKKTSLTIRINFIVRRNLIHKDSKTTHRKITLKTIFLKTIILDLRMKTSKLMKMMTIF